jgi:Histidine kinase-, DNA gyrase B-, and HSP90-like ATPase
LQTGSIKDNGHGMTEQQFRERFMKFGYNRKNYQGSYAEIPPDNKQISKRPAFGKNAKGKFAAFLFGDKFFVRTWRENLEFTFEVFPNYNSALAFKDSEAKTAKGHGTEIFVERARASVLSPEQARSEIGLRFLTDPHFEVFVNDEKVEFSDIPEESLKTIEFNIDGVGKIKITIIDANSTDRTTHQHGVAWWVNGRLVGECSWKGTGQEHLFDGRKIPAKRYTFIVEADGLQDKNAILPDWTGFNPKNPEYLAINEEVSQRIKAYILELTKESREEVFNEIKSTNGHLLKEMSLTSRGKWEDFVKKVQEECPSITDVDLQRLSLILANLETTESKYGLIQQLAELTSENLDDLNSILEKWNVDFAKIVLDELEGRLKLLE